MGHVKAKYSQVVLLILCAVLLSSPSFAALLEGRYSLHFRTQRFPDATGRKVRFTPLTEILDLNLLKLGGRELAFYSETRTRQNLENGEDELDVHFAYLEGKVKSHDTGWRLGRQFISQGLEFFNIDGLWLQTHPIGSFAVYGYGGLPVRERERESRSGDVALGGGASWAPVPNSFFAVNYRREERNSELHVEQVGIEAQIPFGPHVRLVGNLAYDIPLEEAVESLAGIRFFSNLVNASVEFWRFQPHFDLESIFNVFNQGAINEVRGQLTYFLTRDISSTLRVTRQFFEETLARDDENDIVRLAFNWSYPAYGGATIFESLGAELEYQNGFQGSRKGFLLHAARRVFSPRLLLNGALGLTSFQQFFPRNRDGADTDLLLRLGASYAHEDGWGAQLEAERLNDEFTGTEYRLLFSVNVAFNAIF